MYNKEEFYPTPKSLINQMLSYVDLWKVENVLEPSAGSGDILDYVDGVNSKNRNINFDCIEIDSELTAILKDKGYRVVYNDFLKFHTFKKYDLIIMNPPFSNGELHLLKAIDILKNGGQIVCLLNAETLFNQYSNKRKELAMILEEYGAKYKTVFNAFASSESKRKTNVNVVIVYLNIPVKENIVDDSFLKNMIKSEEIKIDDSFDSELDIYIDDTHANAVKRFNEDVLLATKFIEEYFSIKSVLKSSFREDCRTDILSLNVSDTKYLDNNINAVTNATLRRIRKKYWTEFLSHSELSKSMTSNLQEEFQGKLSELRDYDFNLYNIYTVRLEIFNSIKDGVHDTIINLFDELTSRYALSEYSKNIHYYNGWKTNKCFKINKKVILPFYYDCWNFGDSWWNSYNIMSKLKDIEKTFNYLDCGRSAEVDLKSVLDEADRMGIDKNIETKYFFVNLYKKRTMHLTFKDEELLKKFNIYVGKHKNWLPTEYGYEKYEEMDADGQNIVDEFEGKESYQKTFKSEFLLDSNLTSNNLIMI